MNKEQRKFRKTTKARARRKDFVKKKNIITSFARVMKKEGIKYGPPVRLPKSRKLKVKK